MRKIRCSGRQDPDFIFSDQQYLLRTWTGRILLICVFIWSLMALFSGSFFDASPAYVDLLFRLGAKEPVSIARGEWWRYAAPVLLHYNIFHIILNMLALRFVGRLVERQTGSWWFLVVFFLSGVQGNIWSSFHNTALGMGASGAIFGLIGFMITPEYLSEWRRYQQQSQPIVQGEVIDITHVTNRTFRKIPGPFSFMGAINIIFAIVINFLVSFSKAGSFRIDNAAHLGGLVTGLALSWSFLLITRNRLLSKRRPMAGYLLIAILVTAMGLQGVYLSKSDRIKTMLIKEALTEESPEISFRQLQRARLITPEDPAIDFYQGRILLLEQEWEWARKFLQKAVTQPAARIMAENLYATLAQDQTKEKESELLRSILDQTLGKEI